MESLVNVLPVEKISLVIDRIPTAILTLALSYVAIRIIQAIMILGLRATRVTKTLQSIFIQSASAVLWVGAAALTLQSLGLNQIAIALSGSIAIIGIGLASGANKLVSDIVAGFFLAKNRDFKIGEQIELPEVKGRIQSLDARKVRVLGDDGTLFVVPNTKFDEFTWKIMPKKEDK